MGGVEGVLAGGVDRAGGREVHRGGGVPADPGMAVDVVVLGKEPVAEHPGGRQVRECFGEVVQVFQGLELRFGERVVI